jgi:hypothetical protein
VVKSRKVIRAVHVARMGERKVAYRILVRKSETTQRSLVRPGVDGRVIFEWFFKKYDGWG